MLQIEQLSLDCDGRKLTIDNSDLGTIQSRAMSGMLGVQELNIINSKIDKVGPGAGAGAGAGGDPWLAGAGECDQSGDPGQEDPPGGQPLAGCSTGLRLYGIHRENSVVDIIYCIDFDLEFGWHRD